MNDLVASENGARYSIRYDGMDADAHQLDLNQLGVSLQGFARILAVMAHFSYTGTYNKQYDALSVKVFAVPTDDHHCFEVTAWITRVATSEYLWSGTGGALLVTLINHFFSKRRAEEMKYLSEALKVAMGQNQETTQQLLATIQKMMDSLRPSGKQASFPKWIWRAVPAKFFWTDLMVVVERPPRLPTPLGNDQAILMLCQ